MQQVRLITWRSAQSGRIRIGNGQAMQIMIIHPKVERFTIKKDYCVQNSIL